jgi:hypothetical protein
MQLIVISPDHDRFYCPVTGVPIFDDDSSSGFFEDAETVVAVLCSGFFDKATFKSQELKDAWDSHFLPTHQKMHDFDRFSEESVDQFLKGYDHPSWLVFCFDRQSPLGSSRLYYVIDWNLERLKE